MNESCVAQELVSKRPTRGSVRLVDTINHKTNIASRVEDECCPYRLMVLLSGHPIATDWRLLSAGVAT